jgi:flavin-dependent dehydrogenase
MALRIGGTAQRLGADFIVDASGRARQIVRTLGVQRRVYDRLVGAIGVLASGAGATFEESWTEIEACSDGWWYSSPLPDGCLIAGYMTDADSDTARAAHAAAGWELLLGRTTHLRKRVPARGYRLQGPIQRLAADSSRLEQVAGDGWYAVGDAAAAHDPLSSQGIASALAAGMAAASAIATGCLAEYEDWAHHEYAYYLAEWLGYYALERRWAGSPFWQRRHRLLEQLQ